MDILLITRPDSPGALDTLDRVAKKLISLGLNPVVTKDDADKLGLPDGFCCRAKCRADAIKDCELVIAIGGDGTIFHAAAEAMTENKAVLGINAGRLGFLTQLEANDLDRLSLLKEGRYTVEERLVLEAEVLHKDGTSKRVCAVNDVVLTRSDFGRVFDIEVACDGDRVGTYRADGIIFATPTGSTAYSLSAGGPIADPTVSCILMTPLASHSLVSRSIVFSGEKTLTACSPDSDDDAFYLLADGKSVDAVLRGDIVSIKKSEYKTRLICLEGHNFYRTLNDKMKNRG